MSPEDLAELEALQRDVAALGGDPDAVLERANQERPNVQAQMPMGQEQGRPSTQLGNPYNEYGYGPVATPDPPKKRAQPEIRQGTPREDWWKLSHAERTKVLEDRNAEDAAYLGADFKFQEERDARRRDNEFRQNQTIRAEHVKPGSPAWWDANQNRQVPMDRDERDRQALLIGTETDPDPALLSKSDEQIGRFIDEIEFGSSHGQQQGSAPQEYRIRTTRRPQDLANQANRDPRTGNARANIRPEDIERVLRKRQELKL